MNNKSVRKTITISKGIYDFLLEYFENNHPVDEFLIFLVEQSTEELKKSQTITVEIDISNLK